LYGKPCNGGRLVYTHFVYHVSSIHIDNIGYYTEV
jgi:hypothetical protein